jgi:hypothetical protein
VVALFSPCDGACGILILFDLLASLVCILDALDECQDSDRSRLIQVIRNLYVVSSKYEFLLTSRSYHHIRREFRELENSLPIIHLSGEGEIEIEKISREIDLVIQNRVGNIGRKRFLEFDGHKFPQEQFTLVLNRIYLCARVECTCLMSLGVLLPPL